MRFFSSTCQIPHSLYKEGGYDHREALFGIPPYGGSIAQNVYYAESELCDSSVDTSTGVPSRKKDKDGKMEPWPSPFILMVDRGGCTFVKKVRWLTRYQVQAFAMTHDIVSLSFCSVSGPKRATCWCGRSNHCRHDMPLL